MNKKEAAEYLGVSVRSLERYTKKKLVDCTYEQGKIGPRPVYEKARLAAFKAQQESRKKRQSVQVASPDALQRIGFRLEPHYIQRLAKEGALNKMSPGEYARRLLIGAMEDFRHQEILACVSGLREDLDALRADIAQTIEAFLINVVQPADREEARKWVRSTLSARRKAER